jgi:hypothetical protein
MYSEVKGDTQIIPDASSHEAVRQVARGARLGRARTTRPAPKPQVDVRHRYAAVFMALLSVLRGIDRVEELLDNTLEFRVIVLPSPPDRRVRCSMSIATKSTFLSATVKMQTSENNVYGFC